MRTYKILKAAAKIIPAGVLFILFFCLAACQDKQVPDPQFDVSVEATRHRAEESVIFRLSGNPDFLTFYPGTPGRSYQPENLVNGIPIKDLTIRIASYAYPYNTPGTYTATFVGISHNTFGRKEQIRQIDIIIE